MPQIDIDLSGVKDDGYQSLPVGEYLGQIDSIKYRDPNGPGKFAQLMALYTVIEEGELLGKKSTEFISLSPKADFRLKRYFAKFGMGDIHLTNGSFDEDTELMVDPDLVGVQIIFRVSQDGFKQGTNPPEPRYRTELSTVEDDMSTAATTSMVSEGGPATEENVGAIIAEAAAPQAVAAPKVAAAPVRRTLR